MSGNRVGSPGAGRRPTAGWLSYFPALEIIARLHGDDERLGKAFGYDQAKIVETTANDEDDGRTLVAYGSIHMTFCFPPGRIAGMVRDAIR